MIHYHGMPITPDKAAVEIITGRHALVSFAHSTQISLVADISQSFVLDNGAFSLWKSGKAVDWEGYFRFVDDWRRHPGFDWALIPDVIEGTEEANDALIAQWPFGQHVGIPVWHAHESLERLAQLAQAWPRVALGSSGEFSKVGAPIWWTRMAAVMATVCDDSGSPTTKLHGLRMLNPKIFSRLPLASADSTNIGRNIGIDKRWTGSYPPATKAARGLVMAGRIEAVQSAARWSPVEETEVGITVAQAA